MMRKTTILLVMALAVAFLGFSLVAFGLPKDKQAATRTAGAQGSAVAQKPLPSPANPVVWDEEQAAQSGIPVNIPYVRGGASRVVQAAVPFIDVRSGTAEAPIGNNHMRTQAATGPTGVVHMVYPVVNYTGGVISAADSAIASHLGGLYYYNAYDCSNSNDLSILDGFGLQLNEAGPPADTRTRFISANGGIFVKDQVSGVPVVYGHRTIRLENTAAAGDFSRRGNGTFADGSECLADFSLDSTMTTLSSRIHPNAFPLNESTWVATYRLGGAPSLVGFNYTTDRGLTWGAPPSAPPTTDIVLPTNSPWFNSTDITGANDVFYILSHADPNDPNAFTTTEHPVYLKGTYNPGTGAITFGSQTEIVPAAFRYPGFLSNMIDIDGVMVGDTLHVLWTDWNGYDGTPFEGPGGAVWHAAVLPDGTVQGPHKVTNVNVSGSLPDRSYTLFGFAVSNWPNVELSYDDPDNVLYALWSQPPDDGSFGWADYEQFGALAVYDIFCSASPNNGRAWDAPVNVTATNNPGCSGALGDECIHEDHFSAAPAVANDTVWIIATVQDYPGVQETAIRSGIPKDPGPSTEDRDKVRLYKAPARAPVLSLRGDLDAPPTDTTKFFQISIPPRGATFAPSVRLSNIGLVGFFLDSITIGSGLNDGFLITTNNAVPGTFVAVGGAYDFQVSFNPAGVGPPDIGARTGLLRAYIRSVAPAGNASLPMNITVYVVPTLCFNVKKRIHSGSNFTDVGNQGTIKDQGGFGMRYEPDVVDHDNFYDGGVWIAWDKGADGRLPCASGPRKVSRQIFSDKFLRCLADGYLDSVPGTGAYYNLFLASVATDQADSTLVYKNLWEQSTHPDSSDFLMQTTKVINIGSAPVDSVSMGVLYDVDVDVFLVVSASENVGGDTTVSHLGREWWLGWISGNDVSIDSCSPGVYAYGFMVVPGSIGNPGDTVRPRGGIVYEQSGFSYELDCGLPDAGDSLAQRYSWYLDQLVSTRDRNHDTITGVFEDTLGAMEDNAFICGDNATGPPWRADMGYMTIAKKVYNLPVNGGGSGLVARHGLDALGSLAAGVDTVFSGPGESYTVIHVASSGGGIAGLMANAVTAADWYVNHANIQVGPRQTRLKGDLNNSGDLSASDVVEELQYIFLGDDLASGVAIPVCVADLNNSGDLSASDAILLLNGTFLGSGCPNCLRPCI